VFAAELVDDGFGLDDFVFDLMCNILPNAVFSFQNPTIYC
jgi:hypothetical protein